MSDQPGDREAFEARLEQANEALRIIAEIETKVAALERRVTIANLKNAAYFAAATGEVE